MKFEDQVKEAKAKKLQYRILRDIIFIILGAIFLIISIMIEIKKTNNEKNNDLKQKTTSIRQNKNLSE